MTIHLATIGPQDHPEHVPVEVLRPHHLPGFYVCRNTITDEPLIIHRVKLKPKPENR